MDDIPITRLEPAGLDYMPSSYDCSGFRFIEAARQRSSKPSRFSNRRYRSSSSNIIPKRMRIGGGGGGSAAGRAETASQISDDDCQGGGICPSCRLAVNKDTGRLKWCMGGNDIWRTRIRWMLLIPAVILPVTIIIIAISKSNVIGKLSTLTSHSESTTISTRNSRDITESNFGLGNRHLSPTVRNDLELSEIADRALHPDAETSFLPAESLIASHSHQRHKRDMNKKDVSIKEVVVSTKARSRRRRHTASKSSIDVSTTTTTTASKDQATHSGTTQKLNADSSSSSSSNSGRLKAGLLQELQVNFSRSSVQKTQPRQTRRSVVDSSVSRETSSSSSSSSVDDSRADGSDCDDKNKDDNSDDDDDERSEPEDDEDEDEEDEEEDGVEDVDNESGESESGSEEAASVAADKRRSCESYSNENESPNVWEGNWNEDFIRQSQAKLMLRYMDKTADPCTDFYQYACGNWESYNPIPEDKASFDTFETLRESLSFVIKQLLEDKEQHNDPATSAIGKARNLYRSCMNNEILERRRTRPLLELLDELGGWPVIDYNWNPDNFDWLTLVARLRLYKNNVLISEWIGPDTENSDQYIIQLDQTTLGLPTKDYFLQPSNAIYLSAYKDYIITIATLLGANYKSAKEQAEELILFEIQLANITISPNERHNSSELYKRMTLGELHNVIPEIDWQRYLAIVLARNIRIDEPLELFTMKYLQDLVKLLNRTPPRTVANYLFWRFVRHRVNNLDDRFQDAKQDFYRIILGREKSPPRWKNCVADVNTEMGMAVGSMFVRKYFDEKSKNDTLFMTREIQRTFQELLSLSNWLDPTTQRVASEKVEAMHLRIGYPDFILHKEDLDKLYQDVEVDPDLYFENTLSVLRHLTKMEQDRLGGPVNKTLWSAAPAIVNAYYSRDHNQIVFPAGILQPPFYHRYFPRSLNYGGIGVVIGHEITHGFDDKGRLFDKHGNFHRWWSREAIEEFNQRAACLVDQYGKYTVKEVEMRIDGLNTQGENIADNGGIKQAFKAYERWLVENGDAAESLPGVEANGRQLFFLNFAQVWCGSMRPEAMRNKLKTAVHSPGRYRVIGTLSNFEDFAKVFNCPLGSPMNPIKKCIVW